MVKWKCPLWLLNLNELLGPGHDILSSQVNHNNCAIIRQKKILILYFLKAAAPEVPQFQNTKREFPFNLLLTLIGVICKLIGVI